MKLIKELECVSAKFVNSIREDLHLDNQLNPLDHYGALHNFILDQLSYRLGFLVSPLYYIDHQLVKDNMGLDLPETERRIRRTVEELIQSRPAGATLSSLALGSRKLGPTAIYRSNPLDLVETLYINGKLTILQKEILSLYLYEGQRSFAGIGYFIELSREFEGAIALGEELSSSEKGLLLRSFSVGKYAAWYAGYQQSDPDSRWDPSLGDWWKAGDTSLSQVNWWKVVSCAIIGSLVGGPGNFVGSTAMAILLQLQT